MSNRNIGTILKRQRKIIPLTLQQLSDISGVSISHLGRIKQGERRPSPQTLQKIAKPLGYDLDELLTIAGFLSRKEELFSEEQRVKLREEMMMLSERISTDTKRIKEIINRLLQS